MSRSMASATVQRPSPLSSTQPRGGRGPAPGVALPRSGRGTMIGRASTGKRRSSSRPPDRFDLRPLRHQATEGRRGRADPGRRVRRDTARLDGGHDSGDPLNGRLTVRPGRRLAAGAPRHRQPEVASRLPWQVNAPGRTPSQKSSHWSRRITDPGALVFPRVESEARRSAVASARCA